MILKLPPLTYYLLLITYYLLLTPLPGIAQTETAPPETIIQPIIPTPEPLPEVEVLPPIEELIPPLETPPSPPQPSLEGIPNQITIRQFEVIGSTIFSQEQIAEVLEPFTLRSISFAELLQAQRAITQLYIDNGYITSGAFIPPQALQDGVVRIEVIEGEVEAIEINGLERLNSSYVRSRLALATKAPLNQDKLLRALQMLQLDPLIANISAELAAGSRPGISLLEVQLQEADTFSVELSLDNQRSPSVGSVRRQVQLTQSNLLGLGDRFNVSYINTDGSNSLSDLSYTIPINPYNGTIRFSHSRTESEIIEEPFDVLDIDSETRQYELTYRQPLYQTPNKDFSIGITFSRDEAETTVFDQPFDLSRGANNQGETKISALRFFQEYTNRNQREVLALRSQFSLGIDALDATINNSEPDSEFFVWRGQAQYLRLLSSDTILLLRSDLQLADQALVPFEQFSLGGQLSVRGYRQDALLADHGLFASAEIRTPILRIPEWETVLQLTPFIDFGTVWNSDDLELEESTLVSVGLGLRLLLGNNFRARLDWGIPLVGLDDIGDSSQEDGLYFSVSYRIF
ncbi:MAG: ShlB/FhaC/HecB family hemolysin secretion/activation protein [Symploca sp. SIO2E9]|nr:ShlB/FhaC/HecB family hemolysin secretion/activation protein [Symploca sp. SIO2E9]